MVKIEDGSVYSGKYAIMFVGLGGGGGGGGGWSKA
jgi:hypothetical protein